MAYGDSTLGTMEYELSGMVQKRRVLMEKRNTKGLRSNEHNQLDILNSNIEQLKEGIARVKRRLR